MHNCNFLIYLFSFPRKSKEPCYCMKINFSKLSAVENIWLSRWFVDKLDINREFLLVGIKQFCGDILQITANVNDKSSVCVVVKNERIFFRIKNDRVGVI